MRLEHGPGDSCPARGCLVSFWILTKFQSPEEVLRQVGPWHGLRGLSLDIFIPLLSSSCLVSLRKQRLRDSAVISEGYSST